MSTTATTTPTATDTPAVSTLPMKFEVTVIPVADVDRAKAFYLQLGWRLDIDFEPIKGVRGVQFTPPGSPASIQFGTAPSAAPPGSLAGMILVVDDLEQARNELIGRGVEVSEPFHFDYEQGPVPGYDPEHRSYFTRASFADPDGNQWHLQEITERLPGR